MGSRCCSALAKPPLSSHDVRPALAGPETHTLQPVGEGPLALVTIDWCEASTLGFSYIRFWGSWLCCSIHTGLSQGWGWAGESPTTLLSCPSPSLESQETTLQPLQASPSQTLRRQDPPITEVGMTHGHQVWRVLVTTLSRVPKGWGCNRSLQFACVTFANLN